MSLHGKLLDAANAVGPGVIFEFDTPKSQASIQVVVTGDPQRSI